MEFLYSKRLMHYVIPYRLSRERPERGQGLVEFAAIFPAFILLIFVLVDGGFLLGRYNSINNSAKEGARLGAVGANQAEIVTRVKEQAHGYLDSVGANGNCGDWGNASVEDVICVEWISGPGGEGPGTAGASVRVRIRHEYDYLTPLVSLVGIGDMDVKVCAIQRQEFAISAPVAVSGVDSCDD